MLNANCQPIANMLGSDHAKDIPGQGTHRPDMGAHLLASPEMDMAEAKGER